MSLEGTTFSLYQAHGYLFFGRMQEARHMQTPSDCQRICTSYKQSVHQNAGQSSGRRHFQLNSLLHTIASCTSNGERIPISAGRSAEIPEALVLGGGGGGGAGALAQAAVDLVAEAVKGLTTGKDPLVAHEVAGLPTRGHDRDRGHTRLADTRLDRAQGLVAGPAFGERQALPAPGRDQPPLQG